MNFSRIVCKDGTTLSVQTGDGLYCEPRNNVGPYTQVEVGFPSVTPPDSWTEYSETEDNTSNIFGYIPVSLVEDYIASHGGIDIGKTWIPIAAQIREELMSRIYR